MAGEPDLDQWGHRTSNPFLASESHRAFGYSIEFGKRFTGLLGVFNLNSEKDCPVANVHVWSSMCRLGSIRSWRTRTISISPG
jgi:hypothetical protein